jgi:hypothetical protein
MPDYAARLVYFSLGLTFLSHCYPRRMFCPPLIPFLAMFDLTGSRLPLILTTEPDLFPSDPRVSPVSHCIIVTSSLSISCMSHSSTSPVTLHSSHLLSTSAVDHHFLYPVTYFESIESYRKTSSGAICFSIALSFQLWSNLKTCTYHTKLSGSGQ